MRGIDECAWPRNEMSTGAIAAGVRPGGIDQALAVVEKTPAAGGATIDVTQTDLYYFAPKSNSAEEGELYVVFLSPAAITQANVT